MNGLASSAAIVAGVLMTLGACASQPARTGSSCSAPEYRQLDFKLGRFRVTAASGERAGDSRVETILEGCALVEHWRGALSGEGRAHYAWDRAAGVWRMLFLSSTGELIAMTGRAEGPAVVFEGENRYAGFAGLHRMTWSPLPGGGVRQHWQLSRDGGQSWQPVFDGRYVRSR